MSKSREVTAAATEDDENKNTRYKRKPRVGPAWVDEGDAAIYTGYSRDQFRTLVARGTFKAGVRLTPGSKFMFKISDLDEAFRRAALSRKPKRSVRGVVEQRLMRQRQEAADAR